MTPELVGLAAKRSARQTTGRLTGANRMALGLGLVLKPTLAEELRTLRRVNVAFAH